MEPRRGINKINFRALARELNISAMTLYRVINNVPSVKPGTRNRVIEVLNRHGFYSLKHSGNLRIVFDFSDNAFQRHYGMRLLERLAARGCRCVETDHRKNSSRFQNAVAESDVVVFCSVPGPDTVDLVRRINPRLCSISLYTRCGADITISSDNTLGGELAAEHLHRMGHRHIAVVLALGHPTRIERYQSFFARMKLLDPGCRIDSIKERREFGLTGTILRYLESAAPCPTALFFPAGGFAQQFYDEAIASAPERFSSFSIMSYDRPGDFWPPVENAHEFDRIEFHTEELLDWAEYYIINRPMMESGTPIHTCIQASLRVVGSVKNLSGTLLPEQSEITKGEKDELGETGLGIDVSR
ncbi:LacI family DNA-binding transcriptional regulator [uncultured Victivallis sp.]|uniref:LacI family DNA-binding transcriptional regulator n=1 Tax=uncultured Victivallis sp. TaxID=354118 RepID=UPI0025CE67C8|nr:LacI family DNA-binding transcriptional regulator [uncultured Victivallis sp.]